MSYQCPFCHKSFASSKSRTQHIKSPTHHYLVRQPSRTLPVANHTTETPPNPPANGGPTTTPILLFNKCPIPMMLGDESTFASPPFEFRVDGKAFYIHKSLVCKVSEPLNRLVSGPMCEAENGHAVLEEVDPDTFNRFCQWVYIGIYDTAEVVVSKSTDPSSSVCSNNDTRFPVFWGEPTRSSLYGQSFTFSRDTAKTRYTELYDTTEAVTSNAPRSKNSPLDDFTEVFLSHAWLYVFAEKYDIRD